jgi:hypothetical protein
MVSNSCIKNHLCSTKNFLDLINAFGNVAGYKINIKLSRLSIVQQLTKKETTKTSPLTSLKKNLKTLSINLTNEVKDLYNGNDKILKKK